MSPQRIKNKDPHCHLVCGRDSERCTYLSRRNSPLTPHRVLIEHPHLLKLKVVIIIWLKYLLPIFCDGLPVTYEGKGEIIEVFIIRGVTVGTGGRDLVTLVRAEVWIP